MTSMVHINSLPRHRWELQKDRSTRVAPVFAASIARLDSAFYVCIETRPPDVAESELFAARGSRMSYV